MKRLISRVPALALLGYFPPIYVVGCVLGAIASIAQTAASFGFSGSDARDVVTWPTDAYHRALESKVTRIQRKLGRF
jgi:hypothetical protein